EVMSNKVTAFHIRSTMCCWSSSVKCRCKCRCEEMLSVDGQSFTPKKSFNLAGLGDEFPNINRQFAA
ncbi:hypothetical protein HAX54_000371, partial [Datura stramonium]|nr:hypothetical protein [Datura stramonium]